MAVSIVQSTSGNVSNANPAVLTLTLTGVVAGNILQLSGASWPGLPTVSDSQGNTWTMDYSAQDPGTDFASFWQAKCPAGGSVTVTVTGVTGGNASVVFALSEVSTGGAGTHVRPLGTGSTSTFGPTVGTIAGSSASSLSTPNLAFCVQTGSGSNSGWTSPPTGTATWSTLINVTPGPQFTNVAAGPPPTNSNVTANWGSLATNTNLVGALINYEPFTPPWAGAATVVATAGTPNLIVGAGLFGDAQVKATAQAFFPSTEELTQSYPGMGILPLTEPAIAAFFYPQVGGWKSLPMLARLEFFGDTGAKLVGRAQAVVTGTGDIPSSGGAAALDGDAQAVATGTGALTTAIQLAGAAAAVVTAGAANLSVPKPLAGAAQAQATAAGALTTAIQLAGAAQDIVTAAGALTTGIPLQGAATAQATAGTATLTTGVPLAGAAQAQATAAGALTTAIQLAGAAADVATGTGALTTGIPLQGAAAAVVTGTADLTTSTSSWAGTALVVATAGAAALDVPKPLAGTAAAQATAAGALTTGIPLQGAAQATAAGTASLTTAIQLAGAAQDIVTAAGALTTGIPLQGAAAAVATAGTAALSVPKPLAGAAQDIVTAAGALTTGIPLQGAAAAVATAGTANLQTAPGTTALQGAATVQSTAGTASLTTQIRLTGAAQGVVTAGNPILGKLVALAGAAADVVTASGALTTGKPIQGAASAQCTATGALTTGIRLAGAAQVQVTAAGNLSARYRTTAYWPEITDFEIDGTRVPVEVALRWRADVLAYRASAVQIDMRHETPEIGASATLQ